LPAQSYFYDHDIFPLAFCEVSNNDHLKKLNWKIKDDDDDVWSIDYKIPSFKIIHLNIELKKEGGKIPKYSDRIGSISIKQNDDEKEENIEIKKESEEDIIDELTDEVAKIDPDFIFTEDGDSFTFPYLVHRAEKSGRNLILGREESLPLKKSAKEGGISYFSYGRVYFKPTTQKLLGRIHLDKSNSFVWNESGLQGLYEIARICRMPFHTASRASIGKCLSSLQFYYATTHNDTLIPWKPTLAEHFKTFEELLIADRGGFIFEPKIGVHEQVAEFDFVSLYPNIMFKKNVSAETILCDCCPDSKLRVPELNYNICEKRTGIIPMSLQIVLDRRAEYKKLLKSPTIPEELKTVYDARQCSLKWILVTSFGYLGFNNAKFGRIDAHIAVCAFDRQILLQTAKIAERHGFRVLHGIVDSLWIQKKKNEATKQDYLELKESIETETGFAISFEGVYKWIAFVSSKINNQLPVSNRYFGVFEDEGTLKVRGMEVRRHDTPQFFSKCQQEILEIIAKGNNIEEVRALIPKVRDSCFQKYAQLLKERKVPLKELVFTKRLSKDSNEYQINRNTIENDAIQQLGIEGKSLKAGQILKYVITDYYNRMKKHSRYNRRTIPIELINEKTTTITAYDVRKYTELLAETCNSVTEPFGYAF
jgi:DNA polymerase-2